VIVVYPSDVGPHTIFTGLLKDIRPMRTLSILTLSAALLLNTGCKKDKDDPAPTAAGGGTTVSLTASTPLGVTMSVNGTAVSLPVGASISMDNSSSGETTTPPMLSWKSYGVYFDDIAGANTVFACDMGRYTYSGTMPSDAQFFSFFTTGTIPFGNWEMDPNKIGLTWWDTNGTEWATFWGADQSGSNFTVTHVLEQPSVGISSIKLRSTFVCKLYHENGSGTYQTASGTIVFSYQNM